MDILKITNNDVANGCLPIGSDFCKKVGFTNDKFNGYLWKEENVITLSLVYSIYEGKGNFLNVLTNIKKLGYDMKAYDCSQRMYAILTKFGFVGNQDIMTYKNNSK